MSANNNLSLSERKKTLSSIGSYCKNITSIIQSNYSRIYLDLVNFNKQHRKRGKMVDVIAQKQKHQNWMAVYISLLLKNDKSDSVPKLTFKYLDLRAKTELKYLQEKARRLNVTYFNYVDIYLSRMLKQIRKIEEKRLKENSFPAIEYGSYGIRKVKTSKTIRIMSEDNSEDEQQKTKKKAIDDQLNKIKKDSQLEYDNLLKSGQPEAQSKFGSVRSKYLVKSNREHGKHKVLTSGERDSLNAFSYTVVTTQSSANEYNACLTEPPKNKKTTNVISKHVVIPHKNTKPKIFLAAKEKASPAFPSFNSRYEPKSTSSHVKYPSIILFQKGDFYY